MIEEQKLLEGFIYRFTNKLNGKMYIGKTRQTLEDRLNAHKIKSFQTSCRNYNCHFYKAIRKYGVNAFETDVLCTIKNTILEQLDKELYELEIFYIDKFKSYDNGYNSDKGGIGTCGMKHSEETKVKIGKGNKGKIISEESKAKMSISAKNRVNDKLMTHFQGLINKQCITILLYYKTLAIAQFKSAAHAGRDLNLDRSSINKTCKGKLKYTGKFPDGTPMVWK